MSRSDRPPGDAPVVEVEFSVTDSTFPFVAVTEDEDCVVELAEMVPRDEGEYAEFFTVTGLDPDRVRSLASSHETLDVTVLQTYDDGALFEFVASGNCPAFALAELGALPREATSVDGTGTLVAEVPPERDAAAVVDAFLREIPGAELRSKRERDSFSPILTGSTLDQLLDAHLTDRQREVLRTAYDAGYYEWPRESSGTDVAADLDISSATFSEHIHAAERNLLAALLGPSTRE